MKIFFTGILLLLTASSSLAASPVVGDRITFNRYSCDGFLNNCKPAGQLTKEITKEMVGSFEITTTLVSSGGTHSNKKIEPASTMPTKNSIDALLANCERYGFQKQSVSYPAGKFDACLQTESASLEEIKTYSAQVPLGVAGWTDMNGAQHIYERYEADSFVWGQ